MLARLAFKWEMLAGNSTVWSMEFSLMDKCPVIKLQVMTRFLPSSKKLVLESMFLELCTLISSHLS
jgi:hypothetical protein